MPIIVIIGPDFPLQVFLWYFSSFLRKMLHFNVRNFDLFSFHFLSNTSFINSTFLLFSVWFKTWSIKNWCFNSSSLFLYWDSLNNWFKVNTNITRVFLTLCFKTLRNSILSLVYYPLLNWACILCSTIFIFLVILIHIFEGISSSPST